MQKIDLILVTFDNFLQEMQIDETAPNVGAEDIFGDDLSSVSSEDEDRDKAKEVAEDSDDSDVGVKKKKKSAAAAPKVRPKICCLFENLSPVRNVK